MFILNRFSPVDTSTVLKELTFPRITKSFSAVIVNSAPLGCEIFDFFVSFEMLRDFYNVRPAVMDMGVSIGLLD